MIKATLIPLLMIFAFIGSPVMQAAEVKTVTLDVQNMTCKFCPITVRKSLEKVDGVVKAKASLETKSATVTFDPAKTNVKALIKATTDAGYPSTLKK
ncbi:MAG: mercury resistance system periplasmic binding protein MerP [Acidiferrobacterales bacterium]